VAREAVGCKRWLGALRGLLQIQPECRLAKALVFLDADFILSRSRNAKSAGFLRRFGGILPVAAASIAGFFSLKHGRIARVFG
jgi:hypothetical protein